MNLGACLFTLFTHFICLTIQTCFDKNIVKCHIRNRRLHIMVGDRKRGLFGFDKQQKVIHRSPLPSLLGVKGA